MMSMCQLIEGFALEQVRGGDVSITELTDDSREVAPGWAFIARQGVSSDGRDYIVSALSRGATAIITSVTPDELGITPGGDVAWVVADPGCPVDQALCSRLAERFFGEPSRQLALVGVTGTNGKTTVSYLIRHLLMRANVRCGLIGTIEIDDGRQKQTAELTTPGPIQLSRLLARMVEHGCHAAAIEVSSHGLDQGRAAGLRFQVGVFTNLTGDHLDYHGTMDAYAAAKAKLFTQVDPRGWAVIHIDDPYAETTAAAFNGPDSHVLRCGSRHGAATAADPSHASDLGATHCTASVSNLAADHTRARFDGPWGSVDVKLPLLGRHNVANTLQAIAAANAVTPVARSLRQALLVCPAAPGRLEPVAPVGESSTHLPSVVVDYAHTHDALENVLLALRPITPGRLWVVFGAGGDRDASKRPKMGAIAARLADHVMVTSDNPRTEDPQAILDQIVSGIAAEPRDRGHVMVEPDRATAIDHVIATAATDDMVLLAGKGHEDYQIIGTTKRHFDDREQATAALTQRANRRRKLETG